VPRKLTRQWLKNMIIDITNLTGTFPWPPKTPPAIPIMLDKNGGCFHVIENQMPTDWVADFKSSRKEAPDSKLPIVVTLGTLAKLVGAGAVIRA